MRFAKMVQIGDEASILTGECISDVILVSSYLEGEAAE